MKILITGIHSALGRAVAEHLTGHEVVGLGRRAHGRFPTVLCDLREGVPPLPAVDVCLHMAAGTDPAICRQRPEEARRVNVEATAALLRIAPRFVFASTGYVYGFQDGVLREDREPEPSDEYARMKCEAERAAAGHPNAVVLRYFFPYGPTTKPDSIVNRLWRRVAAGEEIQVHEGERPFTNPIYITDMAAATTAFCLGTQRGVYNVGGEDVVSIKGLAERIGTLLGKKPVFRHSGKAIKDMVGCMEKGRAVYRPAVGLDAGLRATVDPERMPTHVGA